MSTLAATLDEYARERGNGLRVTGDACHSRLDDITLLEFAE